VQAKDDPTIWVLPKGHVEEVEDPQETAVREVVEEAGVWASINREVGVSFYSVNGAAISVKFYLMHSVGRGQRLDRSRRRAWLPLQKAIDLASHDETKTLLRLADGIHRETNLVP
jgi:8-oxo-dGTP pyrophosphatase MutT (NUDIX family)